MNHVSSDVGFKINTWASQTISGARGVLSQSDDGKVEARFKSNTVFWNTGDLFTPPLGRNPVAYVTEGGWYNGEPAAIWSDRYFCYSTPLAKK
jgi:hypothetical protein